MFHRNKINERDRQVLKVLLSHRDQNEGWVYESSIAREMGLPLHQSAWPHSTFYRLRNTGLIEHRREPAGSGRRSKQHRRTQRRINPDKVPELLKQLEHQHRTGEIMQKIGDYYDGLLDSLWSLPAHVAGIAAIVGFILGLFLGGLWAIIFLLGGVFGLVAIAVGYFIDPAEPSLGRERISEAAIALGWFLMFSGLPGFIMSLVSHP